MQQSDLMICRTSGQTFEVSTAELEQIERLSAAHPLLKGNVPLPDISPREFLRQITAWGNLLNLYKSSISLSGKSQLSRYNPELGYRICTPDEFWSEKVDNTEFGQAYDFSQPFFEQLDQLLHLAYLIPLTVTNCEGSDFINGALAAKNSYLCFGIFNSEDCFYSYMLHNCSYCIDCIDGLRCQFCYDCHTVRNCYQCRSCTLSSDCHDCFFCKDCIGCNNCLFCYGLRHQSYCINNQVVSKTEYESYLAQLQLQTRSGTQAARAIFHEKLLRVGHTVNTHTNTEDCSGEFITNSQNVYQSFYTHNAHDCGHLMLSHDCSHFWRGFAESAELGYQAGAHHKTYCVYNCYMDVGGSFNLYSLFTYNSCQHCFGCVGLNKKSYCILNRQYTKNEYFEMVPRIISHMQQSGEWGRFFPAHLAPHYYQDSFCNDWLSSIPIAEASKRGYRVRTSNLVNQEHQGIIANKTADSIEQIDSSLCSQTLLCTKSAQPFRIQKKELAFYQQFKIPVPEIHWKERIKSRIGEVFLIPDKI